MQDNDLMKTAFEDLDRNQVQSHTYHYVKHLNGLFRMGGSAEQRTT